MAFLERPPLNLWLVSQDEELVIYEGTDIEVRVQHDGLSFELDIAFGRLSHDEEMRRPYNMSDLIGIESLDGQARRRAFRAFTATTEAAVKFGVDQLADVFKAVAPRLLDPSDDIWRELQEGRRETVKSFGEDQVLRQKRQAALRAWSEGDYQGVVRAYSSMLDSLSSVELKRLDLALKQEDETS